VTSVSQLNSWVDTFVIRWISVVFVVLEGWRVRMHLTRTLLYALVCNSYIQIFALPLFFLDWRNHGQ
jgi:hypothetical protein